MHPYSVFNSQETIVETVTLFPLILLYYILFILCKLFLDGKVSSNLILTLP